MELLNEPGVLKGHVDFFKYTKIIEYKNIDIAIFKIVDKTIGIFPENFSCFYTIVKENFLKNSDEITRYLEIKSKEEPIAIDIRTSLYNMNVNINYPLLLNKYKETLIKMK